MSGPLLLAANHPNSFLDAVILGALFDRPVWSLARGDVFRNKLIRKILFALKILPVYRVSEGVENLSSNYSTFNDCVELFRKNNIVLIFSEGRCINEWKLRPLKKGTARLAVSCWDQGIPLTVLPVGINYNSFRKFGKNVFLNFGEPVTAGIIADQHTEGRKLQAFNQALQSQLKELVFHIDSKDQQTQQDKLSVKVESWKKWLLSVPAAIGWVLHAPLYFPVRHAIRYRARNSDHYDSLMTSLLLFTYPLYLLLASLLAWLFFPSAWVLLAVLLLPLTAWSYVQLKTQLDTWMADDR